MNAQVSRWALVGLCSILGWCVLVWRSDVAEARRVSLESEHLARYYQSGQGAADAFAAEAVRERTAWRDSGYAILHPEESDWAYGARVAKEYLRTQGAFDTALVRSGNSRPTQVYVTRGSFPACESSEGMDAVLAFMAEHDASALTAYINSHACGWLPLRTLRVTIVGTHLFHLHGGSVSEQVVHARVVGSSLTFWTDRWVLVPAR